MASLHSFNLILISKWIAEKTDMQKIEDELLAMGIDMESKDAYLREYNRQKYAARQKNGLVYLVVGAVLGFISCVLTILNPIPEIYYWILYGFTSIAILFICAGLYFVME